MNFETLTHHIIHVQDSLQAQAAHAVNLALTVRNWVVGCYIVEFEQHGEDRAQYGEQLLKRLAKQLNRQGLSERRLREFRQFYKIYPYLDTEVGRFMSSLPTTEIRRSTTAKLTETSALMATDGLPNRILRSATAKSSEHALEPWQTRPDILFNRLSATHLICISNIKEPLKRAFYEQEAIKGCWTVKELDRQVSSLYFERMGLSKDKLALQRITANDTEALQPHDNRVS